MQADYTRDFLTACFSHPAIKGFMIWGFWEGAHWEPPAAMIRRDWSTKPNYDAWNDLIYRQWWTDTSGVTESDGTFRTRGFLGDYAIEVTIDGVTKTYPLSISSNTQPAFLNLGKTVAGAIAANGVVNAASFRGGAIAPGEIVTIYGSGFGPAVLAAAQYTDGQLPASVGETRVLFDGAAAPMIYSSAGQVSAIVPYAASETVQVQVEYQGIATAPLPVAVTAAAPGHLYLSRQAGHRARDSCERRRRTLLQPGFRSARPRLRRHVLSHRRRHCHAADCRWPPARRAGLSNSRSAMDGDCRRGGCAALRRHVHRPRVRRRDASQLLHPGRRATWRIRTLDLPVRRGHQRTGLHRPPVVRVISALQFPAGSADQWFMPTDPIIILLPGSFFAWLFDAED